MTTGSDTLLTQRFLHKTAEAYRKNRVPFLASLLFGFLAYTFLFVNKIPNHDDIFSLFTKGSEVVSGRWSLPFMSYLFPDISMPWIYGVLTLLFMAVSVCVILNTFQIQNRTVQVLLAGTIMVFPSLIGQLTYMFTSTSYAVSFLLSVSAVFLLRKNTLPSGLLAVILIAFALGIYQAYLAVIASLLVVSLIQDLLQGEPAAAVGKRGVFYVAALLSALVLYYLCMKLSFRMEKTELGNYAANAISFELASLPSGILTAYTAFIRYFTSLSKGLIPTVFSLKLHALLFVTSGVLFLLQLVTKRIRKAGQLLLLAFLIALLPLSINCMWIVIQESAIHALVQYSFTALYVLAAVLADPFMAKGFPGKPMEYLRRICLDLTSVALVLIIAINTYVANAGYLQMQLRYESTHAFYTTLAASLQQTPGVSETTRLAVIGWREDPAFGTETFPNLSSIAGLEGLAPHLYAKEDFMESYLGLSLPFASDKEISALMQTPEYAKMPLYPYYGSIQMIGDYLVVRLS